MAQALKDAIPCEFCETLIPLVEYDSHWRICSQEVKKAARQPIDKSNEVPLFFIPCEFCETPISSTEYDTHTRHCDGSTRRGPSRLFKNDDQVRIPCEYCQKPITKQEWTRHTRTCLQTDKVELDALSTFDSFELQNELIPCEYCTKSIQVQKYESHVRECSHQTNVLINRSEVQPNVGASVNFDWPEYWDVNAVHNLTRYILDKNSQEYTFVAKNFHSSLAQNQIVQVERIQNRRWYRQYAAHRDDFIERYGESTERWLFHGCRRGDAAEAIIKDCFNRSHAVNCAVGQGIYFATKSAISLGYTSPDAQGQRHMLMARVLVGRTTTGNRSTRVCPPGFDTTGTQDVFVTYHDAQAYGQYIIVFR